MWSHPEGTGSPLEKTAVEKVTLRRWELTKRSVLAHVFCGKVDAKGQVVSGRLFSQVQWRTRVIPALGAEAGGSWGVQGQPGLQQLFRDGGYWIGPCETLTGEKTLLCSLR